MSDIININDFTKKNEPKKLGPINPIVYALGGFCEMAQDVYSHMEEIIMDVAREIDIPENSVYLSDEQDLDILTMFEEFMFEGHCDITVNFASTDKGMDYQIIICCELSHDGDDEVTQNFIVYAGKSNGKESWEYDFENGIWEKGQDVRLPQSPYTDFQRQEAKEDWGNAELLTVTAEWFGPISDEDYKYLKIKWKPLINLCKQTKPLLQMEFVCRNPELDSDVHSKDILLTLIPSDDRRDGFFITINNGEFELYQSLELEDISEDVADIFELCDEETNNGYAKKVFSTKNFKEIVWTIHHLANRYTGDDFVLTIPLSKEAFIDIPYLDDISVSGKINVRRKLTEEELQNLNSVKSWARKMNKIAKKLAEENGLD